MLQTILAVLVVLILFVVAIMLSRTARFGKKEPVVEPVELPAVDKDGAAQHLAAVLRIPTVSSEDLSAVPLEALHDLHRALEKTYPRVHCTLQREVVGEAGLLYTWEGAQPELEPLLFAAHQDVVPADPATLSEWTHDPFGGEISDGFVWGRGALDVKSQMIAVLEAVEFLLGQGYRPQRTIYLAFGYDEEVGGRFGAARIAELLEQRGVHLAAALDEGGAIVNGVVPGVDAPVAMVAIGEKGYLSVKLSVNAQPGHSSAPPPESAIPTLALALLRLQSNPFPAHTRALLPTLQALAPVSPFSLRFGAANLWLLEGVVRGRLEGEPQTNATIRTTLVPTIIQGGVKDNVLPSHVEAIVNLRLMPGDELSWTLERLNQIVDDDRVEIEALEGNAWEASPVSPYEGPVFETLERTIRQCFPEAGVAPFLETGATDARYYTRLCPAVYRFSPYRLSADELRRIHGIDERLAVDSMGAMVAFFVQLIQNWDGVQLG